MFGRIVGLIGAVVLVGGVSGVTAAAVVPGPAARALELRTAPPHEDEPAPPEEPGGEGEDDSGDDYAR
jgi:hypothetical protein